MEEHFKVYIYCSTYVFYKSITFLVIPITNIKRCSLYQIIQTNSHVKQSILITQIEL